MKFSLATAAAYAASFALGDSIGGYDIIEKLDLAEVPPNSISRYWISPAQAQGGLPYFLPIFVARGTAESLESGRRFSLSASIHGDELNGVAVVQKVFQQLNETSVVSDGNFNGTIIGISTQNPNGNLFNQRNFYSSSGNGRLTDLNRVFPGESIMDGGAITDNYAYSIWNQVWGNTSNVDLAVDLRKHHSIQSDETRKRLTQVLDTLGTGSDGPLWAYADYRFPYVQRIAELAQPDAVKIDPGDPGTIETSFIEAGVPAITLEIGPAKNWNQSMILRATDFIFRLLDDVQMTSGGTPEVVLDDVYRATNFSEVSTVYSGWVEMDVGVLEDVEEGQHVGTVYNSWGDVLESLTSSVTGRVLQVRTDPAVEMGSSVASIMYNATMEGN